MATNNETDVEQPAGSTTSNYNDVDEMVPGTTYDPIQDGQGPTNYGATLHVLQNENPLNGIDARYQIADNFFYIGAESLLNRQLILAKGLKASFDIRYKTNYFPLSGKNAGKPQTPRWLRTVDGEEEIIIKFANGYIPPPNPDDYYLEVCLLTVARMNQYYKHVNKFQLHHTDVTVLDENPFYIRLTQENFDRGEIRVKLVLIKTCNRELESIKYLPLFNEQTPSGEITDCKSGKDLTDTYTLNRATIAFSLGYFNTNGDFIHFPLTTVISNEIVEIEKSEEADNVTCPKCSHRFNAKKQKEKARKRPASSSNSNKKKRSS